MSDHVPFVQHIDRRAQNRTCRLKVLIYKKTQPFDCLSISEPFVKYLEHAFLT